RTGSVTQSVLQAAAPGSGAAGFLDARGADHMNTQQSNIHDDSPDPGKPPRDELDTLLQTWHQRHAERAAAVRDQILSRCTSGMPAPQISNVKPAAEDARDIGEPLP